MSALLFIPAAPLAFAALGSAARALEARSRRLHGEAGRRLMWCLSLAAGAIALGLIAAGRLA